MPTPATASAGAPVPAAPLTASPLAAASPADTLAAGPLSGNPPPDPLAGLGDWHLPDPVSWWPPAPGWWLLAALVVTLIVLAVLHWRARRRRDAALRTALAELARLRANLKAGGMDGLTPGDFTAAVSILLRRLALTRFARARVAGLSGHAWLDFLDETGGGGAFAGGPGRLLADLPYRPPGSVTAADLQPLAELAERWIRTRPVPPSAAARPRGRSGSPATGHQSPAPVTAP